MQSIFIYMISFEPHNNTGNKQGRYLKAKELTKYFACDQNNKWVGVKNKFYSISYMQASDTTFKKIKVNYIQVA